MCPVGKNLWVSFQKFILFKLGLNLQNQVSGFSKSFGLFKSGLLAVAISKILLVSKLAQVFVSKSSASNLLRFPKSASRFSGKVLASRQFRLAKSVFIAKVIFCKIRFLKLASRLLAKVSARLGRAFSPGLFFLASFVFGKVSFQQRFRQVLGFCVLSIQS